MASRGYFTDEYAAYPSHLHYEYLDGKHWLFGGTMSHNWTTNAPGYKTLVFVIEADSVDGDLYGVNGTSDYQVRELERADFD